MEEHCLDVLPRKFFWKFFFICLSKSTTLIFQLYLRIIAEPFEISVTPYAGMKDLRTSILSRLGGGKSLQVLSNTRLTASGYLYQAVLVSFR